MTPDQRLAAIAEIIEAVDNRCLATDGAVGDTREEMTKDEMIRIYDLASGRNIDVTIADRPVLRALAELCAVKALKERAGKTEEYERRQPEAWAAAARALKDSPPMVLSHDVEAFLDMYDDTSAPAPEVWDRAKQRAGTIQPDG